MLRDLPTTTDPNVLVGFAKSSDAGVYRISDTLAMIQTVDFFTPIVDDPYLYGQIAAANSLSDVYAMGGRPVTALNVAAIPSKKVTPDVILKVLLGAHDKAAEAGCAVVGGHTLEAPEMAFGLSVTGLIDPAHLVTNEGARPGDLLVLTKALGTGIITTAAKLGRLPPGRGDAILAGAIGSMVRLNKDASIAMVEAGARGATDITGFGLIGHAMELASASGVTLGLRARSIPVLEGALELAEQKVLTGADRRNREFTAGHVRLGPAVGDGLARVLFDAQTSGGLLISLPKRHAEDLAATLTKAGHTDVRIVGEVLPLGAHLLVVE
ncbi:MAG: selenide, water dikinase SelD [Candidatus Riflebacteria bacterium]|nr:selenide, water dikinase SelD [Candidatus Riflebacteria bacterium]